MAGIVLDVVALNGDCDANPHRRVIDSTDGDGAMNALTDEENPELTREGLFGKLAGKAKGSRRRAGRQ
jgi:hypothetical protein